MMTMSNSNNNSNNCKLYQRYCKYWR